MINYNRSDWTFNQSQTEALLERIVFLVIELKLKHCIIRRGFYPETSGRFSDIDQTVSILVVTLSSHYKLKSVCNRRPNKQLIYECHVKICKTTAMLKFANSQHYPPALLPEL